MPGAVLKIGGSLGLGEVLPPLCHALSEMARRHTLLIVPGGGVFADAVRLCHNSFPLGESTAHWMAILGMEQYGLLLADLIPGSHTVVTLKDAELVTKQGRVPVFLPHGLMRRSDPLPHSWDVTSDSIAAWIALQSKAHTLVLVKDQDGLYARPPESFPDQKPMSEMPLPMLASCKGVDSYLPFVLADKKLKCWVVNGKEPERLAALLDTGTTLGTFIDLG